MAEKQIHAALAGRSNGFGQVLDLDTELAAALVDIEFASLEDRLNIVVATIEILKDDEIVQQAEVIAAETQQFLDRLNGCSVGFHLLGHGLGHCRFASVFPCRIGVDLGENAVPFGLRDALTTGEIDIEHKFLERGESRLPGGIDTTREG